MYVYLVHILSRADNSYVHRSANLKKKGGRRALSLFQIFGQKRASERFWPALIISKCSFAQLAADYDCVVAVE